MEKKECVQLCMKTTKEAAKNEVVDILFFPLFLKYEAAPRVSTHSPPPLSHSSSVLCA